MALAMVVGGVGFRPFGRVFCGSALDRHLDAWLNRPSRLVLDADGLNALGRYPASAQLLRDRAARGRHTVLTPHPLEAARLLGVPTEAVQADRLDSARRLD